MEGRWAVLAVRAARLGALDYSEISRNDPGSLDRETLILSDIERCMTAEFFRTMALGEPDRAKRSGYILDALTEEMPWEVPKKGQTTNRLVDLWHQHEANKKKQQKKGTRK